MFDGEIYKAVDLFLINDFLALASTVAGGSGPTHATVSEDADLVASVVIGAHGHLIGGNGSIVGRERIIVL